MTWDKQIDIKDEAKCPCPKLTIDTGIQNLKPAIS
jgi:hypothetical protein